LNELLDLLDEAGVTHYVDLDGVGVKIFYIVILNISRQTRPSVFKFLGRGLSQWEIRGNGFPDWAAGRLKVQKEAGAQGLKIWKPFGLHVKDHHGQLVKVDDARLSPIWKWRRT